MKSKNRLIRLVVYLVVSVSLIVFLWVIPKKTTPKSEEKKITNESIAVDLPDNSEIVEPEEHLRIDIDSNNNYYFNSYRVSWDELVDSISVQHDKKPKLSILISVDNKAKSGNVAKILELAKEKEMKVGIGTLNN